MYRFSEFKCLILCLVLLGASGCTPGGAPIVTATATVEQQDSHPTIHYLDLSGVSLATAPSPTFAPSPTPFPTAEPSPTAAPTEAKPQEPGLPSPTPEPTQPFCVNRAEFVKHLNVSDYTAFKPGESIAKIWLIKNVGTCTWTINYQLVFVGGDPMQNPEAIPLAAEVPPGEMVELRVNLIAPVNPNSYANQWMLQDESGNLFGIGESNQPLQVIIIVQRPLNYEPMRL